ncbi:class I SAM-dependent methyltransferase [Methylovulum psychrotolerans]|nr:class I SAM-dependent methyltransferase [Methylovulum psychrotolerans]
MIDSESKILQQYYSKTAHDYDALHVSIDEKDEHFLALAFMVAASGLLGIKSILDIGSGTGRAIKYVKQHAPDILIVGIEPVEELRSIGYQKGIAEEELIEGDATNLAYSDASFDLVCAFGVLHHIKYPELAVSEMLRVAKKGIFISDSNNFGQGSVLSRTVKQIINEVGLWKVADFIKTLGKGYTLSEGDGLAYSYSVFNNYNQIQKACNNIHILNTKTGSANLYRTASHIGLLGIKNE